LSRKNIKLPNTTYAVVLAIRKARGKFNLVSLPGNDCLIGSEAPLAHVTIIYYTKPGICKLADSPFFRLFSTSPLPAPGVGLSASAFIDRPDKFKEPAIIMEIIVQSQPGQIEEFPSLGFFLRGRGNSDLAFGQNVLKIRI